MASSKLAARAMRNHAKYRGRNDLNIVPMIDMMVILVFFLLFTAVFSNTNILELNLPAPNSSVPELNKGLELEVIVRQNVIEIADRGTGILRTLPKKDGEYDYQGLSDYLQFVKSKYQSVMAASVLLEHVRTEAVVPVPHRQLPVAPVVRHHVDDGQGPSRTQHPARLRERPVGVLDVVEHEHAGRGVDLGVGEREVVEGALAELDVRERRGAGLRELEHPRAGFELASFTAQPPFLGAREFLLDTCLHHREVVAIERAELVVGVGLE